MERSEVKVLRLTEDVVQGKGPKSVEHLCIRSCGCLERKLKCNLDQRFYSCHDAEYSLLH